VRGPCEEASQRVPVPTTNIAVFEVLHLGRGASNRLPGNRATRGAARLADKTKHQQPVHLKAREVADALCETLRP